MQDIYVERAVRRTRGASMLVLHLLLFILRGPRHVTKMFALVHENNRMATGFFEGVGFAIEPDYKVPKRFKRPQMITYMVNNTGVAADKLSKQLEVRCGA